MGKKRGNGWEMEGRRGERTAKGRRKGRVGI